MGLTKQTLKGKILDDTLVGLIRGTEIVHSLPSYLISRQDNKEWDHIIGRTKLEKIVKALTVAGEAYLYYWLAQNGTPAHYIPATTNIFDAFWYGMEKLIQATGPATGNNPDKKIDWKRGALFEDNLPSVYHHLPL